MAEQKKLEKLEAIRGFAAIYVVFYHLFASGFIVFGINLSFLFRFGQEAVILFFLLSGFVIYYSFKRSKDISNFKVFFWKRSLRIYIPLLIIFLTNYLLICFYKGQFIRINIPNLLGNLLMLQDNVGKKPNVITEPFLNNDPLWSLSYEWWFYFLFFTIINLKWIKNKDLVVFTLSIVSALTYILFPNFINRELMYFSIWWSGLYLAKLYMSNTAISYRTIRLPLISLIAICVILCTNFLVVNKAVFSESGALSKYPILEFRHFLFTLIIMIIIPVWIELKWFGFNLIFGPFKYLASISFVIYISHWFLIYQARYFQFIENKNLRLVCYFAVCLLFSYILERILYPRFYKVSKQLLKF